MSLLLALACADRESASPEAPFAYPDPAAWAISGPGGPASTFASAQLDVPCAALTGGPEDVEHHNLVGMYDGWLVLPWAPEDGGGGVTLFDFSEPCAPVKVGEAYSELMRESHTLAIAEVDGRTILAVDMHRDEDHGGIGFWDLTDPAAPFWLSDLELPEYHYPDAYFRVALSTFWQGDILYVSSGLNGVFLVDVSDPADPTLISQWSEIAFITGSFHVIGNLALASSAGLSRTMLWDVADPENWQLLADWQLTDLDGELRPYYFANIGGRYALFARKDQGGGTVVVDITDPFAPVVVGMGEAPEGDGGYVARHGTALFQGESNFGVRYTFDDPTAPIEVTRIDMAGDFDTLVPIGNVAVASVDENGDPGLATQVFPWASEVDAQGPTAELTSPLDGATWIALPGRIGLAFDEQIEPKSVHAGSLRVWREDGSAVAGRFYAQETIANFVPDELLSEGTTYIVEVPAGGIADVSGNPVEATLRFSFATGDTVRAVAW